MLGVTHQDGSFVNGGSSFRRDGSLMSGSMRGSNFQRGKLFSSTCCIKSSFSNHALFSRIFYTFIFETGGSIRGSDRSMRRDIDDIALSNHLSGSRHFSTPSVQQPLTGYGRKDMDDMVRGLCQKH